MVGIIWKFIYNPQFGLPTILSRWFTADNMEIGLLGDPELAFGAVFVVTEPISGPKTKAAQWIYGFVIGGLTIVIRKFSSFSAGIMFATLFMNMFVPIMDSAVNELKGRSKKV